MVTLAPSGEEIELFPREEGGQRTRERGAVQARPQFQHLICLFLSVL